jgi:hypothetical protein
MTLRRWVTVAALVCSLTACGSRPLISPVLVASQDHMGEATPLHGKDRYLTFLVGHVCVVAGKSITVGGVRPIAARGGAQVTDFGLFHNEKMMASPVGGRLSSRPAYRGTHIVTTPCTDKYGAQLAVEIYKPGLSNAVVAGFKLTYESNGRQMSASMPYGIALCQTRLSTCEAPH